MIFIGTFRKLLFPALRLGYLVLPPPLVDIFVSFRRGSDLRPMCMDEAVLCDFIVAGHFGRHLRRMRNLYAGRLEALKEGGRRYQKGLLEISDAKAGLYTAAFLRDGKTSREAETLAAAHRINTKALDRFTLECPDPKGLLLGFAACDEKTIRQGVIRLASALGA